MKRIYDLLRELDSKKINEMIVKIYLRNFPLNEGFVNMFGEKSVSEYIEILRKEAKKHYKYLLDTEPTEYTVGNVYLVYERSYYDELLNAVVDNYCCVPEKDLEDFLTDKDVMTYSMEAINPGAVVALYVQEDLDNNELYQLMNYVFYETYFFLPDSEIRKSLGGYLFNMEYIDI